MAKKLLRSLLSNLNPVSTERKPHVYNPGVIRIVEPDVCVASFWDLGIEKGDPGTKACVQTENLRLHHATPNSDNIISNILLPTSYKD